MPVGIANKLPVELRPAFGFDLALERKLDVAIGARPQLLRDEILGAGAHAFLDVVARYDQVLAIVGDAAHDDVDVRVLRVPVIDGDPIELGAEILLHLADQLAGEALEVGHLRRVLGRHDESEMVTVLLAPLGEGLRVRVLRLGAEQPGLLPVPGDALAPEVAEMGSKRRRTRGVTDDARLHRHQTRPAGQQVVRPHAGDASAPEGRTAPGLQHALLRDAAAGALRGGERLSDEGFGALAARGTDAARPGLEVALFSHRRPRQCAEMTGGATC